MSNNKFRTKTIIEAKNRAFGKIDDLHATMLVVDPRQLLFLGSYSPHIFLQRVRNLRYEGVESLGGERTVKLSYTTASLDHPGDSFHGAVWLCPDKGYSIAKSELWQRNPNSTEDLLVRRIECTGLRKAGPEYFPAEVRYTEVDNGATGEPQTRHNLHATIKVTELNSRPPESTFDMKFPDGTLVRDEINHKTYYRGQITDAKLASQVQQAKRILVRAKRHTSDNQTENGGPDALKHIGTWIKITLGLLVFFTCMFLMARLFLRRKP